MDPRKELKKRRKLKRKITDILDRMKRGAKRAERRTQEKKPPPKLLAG